MMKINIEYAKRFIGIPYVWGGDCTTEGGLDCSGFIYVVLNGSGIKVARDTAQGYYKRYKESEVSKNIIKAGDLLFFGKSKSSITHIAIAVSATEMIESVGTKSNTIKKKGKGVCINPINRRKDLVAVVRFIENVSRETLVIPSATPVLKRGSMGMHVNYLQKFLNAVSGAGLITDGIFGERTFSALKAFQQNHGLVADGIYGSKTRSVFMRIKG